MKKPERLNTGIVRAAGAKPERMRKPLQSMELGKDPLAHIPPIDDPEEATEVELTELQAGFRDRAKQEAERFKNATDSTYYFCMVFETGAQADAFLAGIGHKGGDLFVDGRAVADRLGIELPAAELKFNISAKVDQKLTRLAR